MEKMCLFHLASSKVNEENFAFELLQFYIFFVFNAQYSLLDSSRNDPSPQALHINKLKTMKTDF